MGKTFHYFQIIIALSFLISFSQFSDSFAHEDEGEKQRDDRVHMTITNDSSNRRTSVTFYYTAITHTGHDHPWIGDSGVKICELGSMNPGESKTCHGPFHSTKSPDQKPECNPVSDWSFSFLISYNEGGNQKSMPLQRGSITSITGDNGESRSFKWDSHTDQVFLDVDCPQPEPEVPPPVVAPDPPDPPTLAVNDPEGDNPTLSGTGDAGTEVRILISEIGFFGFNFFSFDEVVVDKDGNWTVKLKGPLENGVYDVTVVSVDKETGLISDPANNIFVVDRDPPAKPENTCGVGIPEPKKDEVVTVPFVPLPRINGTADLDPDLTRDDKGGFDCALIAVTNNLNYFVNRHNIPRGTDPGQLPSDDSKIIEELRIDMNWQARGVVDADFLTGKNTFVNRYNLPITTTFAQFPTPEQIEEALNQGNAIELNFQFKKGKITLGHTVTVVGITRTSEGITIQIHDPMTKGGKTQDSYELRSAQDRSGNSFWLLMNYPNWDGYTILEGMFVQEYATNDSSNTSVPDSDTSKGTILEPTVSVDIPPWIKNNAKWWSNGITTDREFATGIAFLIKESIIHVDTIKSDPNGDIEIDEKIIVPGWIKNNAKWWSENSISDNDFKSGIQFMVKEKIIQFTTQKSLIVGDKHDSNDILEKETIKEILQYDANALVANNAALKQLLEMQNFVASELDDFSEDVWNQFSENKNQETMESAIQLEDLTQMMKEDSVKTIAALKDSNENIDLFFKESKTNGFDDFVLKNNAEENLKDLVEISNVKSEKDLVDAEKNTKKIDGLIENSIEYAKQFGGNHEGEIPEIIYSQSSRYSLTFESGSIDDRPSTYYGIDSRWGATTCTEDNVCDSDKGETCSSRDPNISGKCIPTWFGICQAWAPLCVMDVYQASKEITYSDSSYSSPIPTEDPPTEDPPTEDTDTDLDNDGIADLQDACPNDPETVNGYEDSDGCPDTPPTADTTPPTITVPQNIVTESGGESITVSFTVTANDNVDGNIAVSCDPSSDTIFTIGTTQVTCTAIDSSDNTSQESFTVTVLSSIPVDSTPPVISVPSNTIIESSEELTPVTFNVLSNDDVDGSITPTCDPPSGFLFSVGTTTVTCTATDSAGNTATKSFTVEIIFVDTEPPEITISSINSIESGDGFIVTYDATAEDNVDSSVEVSCDPPSSSFFPEGTHRITCTATDSAGNTATQAIDVTVTRVE